MTGFGSSCGACKFLRRKCSSSCVFAPYFRYDEAESRFAAVHKVFGASNVSKLLSQLPPHNRSDAATTISYQALARITDPIYGCVAHIYALQQQVAYLQEEIESLGNQIACNLNVGTRVLQHGPGDGIGVVNGGAFDGHTGVQLPPLMYGLGSGEESLVCESLLDLDTLEMEGLFSFGNNDNNINVNIQPQFDIFEDVAF